MLSENIKTIRKSKGLSQEELAVKVNVVRQTVSKWEKGLVVPSAETIKKIADYFQVSTDFIFTEHPDDFQIKKSNEDDNKKKITIIALFASFIWCIAIVVYVASIFNNKSYNNPYWRVFLWAVPATFLSTTILIHRIFKDYKAETITGSLFVWTILLAAFFSFIDEGIYWYLFIIGIPIQISIILIYQLNKNK